jgi:hypothetical protein
MWFFSFSFELKSGFFCKTLDPFKNKIILSVFVKNKTLIFDMSSKCDMIIKKKIKLEIFFVTLSECLKWGRAKSSPLVLLSWQDLWSSLVMKLDFISQLNFQELLLIVFKKIFERSFEKPWWGPKISVGIKSFLSKHLNCLKNVWLLNQSINVFVSWVHRLVINSIWVKLFLF